MLVADLPGLQCSRERFLIELRVGVRRYRSDVDNKLDTGLPQQIDKLDDRPGRVVYGEKHSWTRYNGVQQLSYFCCSQKLLMRVLLLGLPMRSVHGDGGRRGSVLECRLLRLFIPERITVAGS
ncbi:MAG: hypothetical protein ABI192_12545 [Bradyrhizobium sp.]